MSTLQDLAKWIVEREREAFVAGAKWSQRADAGSNHIIFTCEAQRRYPGPEAQGENAWWTGDKPQDDDWPHTCPSCLEWWVEFDYCAVCGSKYPGWRAVERP